MKTLNFLVSIILILLFSGCNETAPTRSGEWRGNEYIKWAQEVSESHILFVGTADVDGDKTQEVIAQIFSDTSNDVISYVIDSSTGNVKRIISRIVDGGAPEQGYYEFPGYYYLTGFYLPSVDIDRDGKEDWFTLDSYYINIYDTKMSLYHLAPILLSGLDSPVWQYKIQSPINSSEIQNLSLFLIPSGVLEENGKQNLIFSSMAPPMVGNNLCVLQGLDGAKKWCNDIENEFNFSLADINEDGTDDIITFTMKKKYDQNNKPISSPKVDVFDGNNGDVLWSTTIDCDEINGSSGDIDNDEIREVVISCSTPPLLKVLNRLDGREKYSFNFSMEINNIKVLNDKIETSIMPVLGDLDDVISNYLNKDSSSEFELQVINGEDGSSAFWYGDFKEIMEFDEIKSVKLWGVEDIDSDGMLEILVLGFGCRANICVHPIIMSLRTDAFNPQELTLLPWPFPRHDKYQKNAF